MKNLIIAFLLSLIAMTASAQVQPALTENVMLDFQQCQSNLQSDFSMTGFTPPYTLLLEVFDGMSWIPAHAPFQIYANINYAAVNICVNENTDTLQTHWRVTNDSTGTVWYSSTTMSSMPDSLTGILYPLTSPLMGRNIQRDTICQGVIGVSSKCVIVGDSLRLNHIEFQETSATPGVDSIWIYLNGNTLLAKTGSINNTGIWLYKLRVDSNIVIVPGDVVTTKIKTASIAPSWGNGHLSLINVNGIPVQSGDYYFYDSPCAPFSEINYKSCIPTSISDPAISNHSVKLTTGSIVSVDENYLIELWNMAGQMVGSGKGKVEIDGLSAGIYLYRIFDAERTFLSTGKFAKTE